MRIPFAISTLLICTVLSALISCGGSRPIQATTPSDTSTVVDGETKVNLDEVKLEDLRDGERQAQELVNLFRQADSVVFSMYIVYRPPEKEHLSFSLTAWSPSDGRLRIRMTKIGVDFLEGLIDKDGNFTGVLVRDNKVIKGKIEDLMAKLKEKSEPGAIEGIVEDGQQGAPLLAAIQLLRDEICHGPLNIRQDGYKIGVKDNVETLYFNLPHQFKGAAILGNRKRNPIDEKIMFNKNDKEVLRLKYDKLKELDGLTRMTKINLILPNDDSQYTLILRELDVVKHIQEKNLYLDVPDYPQISIEDFGKKVVE